MMIQAEQMHRDRFLKYAAESEANGEEGGEPVKPLPLHLRSILSAQVFDDAARAERAAPFKTDLGVLTEAMNAEQYVAELLADVAPYVPARERHVIETVVKEEWAHKAYIEALIRKLVR
jgi:hypothetical protein